MQRIKRLFSFFFRIFLFSLIFLLLIAVIIQFQPVQQYLTQNLEDYLEEKLQTKVHIKSIRLDLPESLVLQEVYLENQYQDSLLSVDLLSLNFKLNKLFQKRIQFDEVKISDGKLDLYFGADSSNIDFILQAFSNPEEDLTTEKENTTSPDWLMTFDDARLSLQNIQFKLKEESAKLDLAVQLGQLSCAIDQIDYLQNQYSIDEFYLANSQLRLDLEGSKTESSSSPNISDYIIELQKAKLEQVDVELHVPKLNLSTQIANLNNKATSVFFNTDSLQVQTDYLEIVDSKLRYDLDQAVPSQNFNYKQLDLTKINLQLSDFIYNPKSILGDLMHFSAKEAGGFQVQALQTKFDLSEEKLELEKLSLATTNSKVASPKTRVNYPFLASQKTSIEQLNLQTKLDFSTKNFTEFHYFLPQLDSITFFQAINSSQIKLNANLAGSLNQLNLKQLSFTGFGNQVIAKGTINNLTRPKQIGFNLNVPTLRTTGKNIVNLLPKGTLPNYLELPDSIQLSGTMNGAISDFITHLKIQTKRQKDQLSTTLEAKASIQNILDWNRSQINLQIDSLLTSDTELLAYLPPKTLPAYVKLPKQLLLKGDIVGDISNLKPKLSLLAIENGETNQFNLIGEINDLSQLDQLSFKLNLNANSISRDRIQSILPDSLLPAHFRFPFIDKLSGLFTGNTKNFQTKVQLSSNTGNWSIDAALQEQDYQLELNVEGLQPNSFFSKAYLESIIDLPAIPWLLELKVQGKGFDLSETSNSKFYARIKPSFDTTMTGLVVKAKLQDQKLTAGITANEEALAVLAKAEIDYRKEQPIGSIDLRIDEFDFQKLRLSKQAFSISGQLHGTTKGANLEDFSVDANLKNVLLQYAEKSERIEQLSLKADITKEKNQVVVNSDFFDAKLNGTFQFDQIFGKLQNQLTQYWQETPTDSLSKSGPSNFKLDFALYRPEILMLGFIPNLQKLSPFQLVGAVDFQENSLAFQSSIPILHWQDIVLEEIELQGEGDQDLLNYQLALGNTNIQNLVRLNKLKSFGKFEAKALHNTTQILDQSDQKRYEIKSRWNNLSQNHISCSLLPEQLLNYEIWKVNENNKMAWFNEKLAIQDCQIFRAESGIEIREVSEDEAAILFQSFDLQLVSNFLKANSNYLGGILNGEVKFKTQLTQALFESELTIDRFTAMDAYLGDVSWSTKKTNNSTIQTNLQLAGAENQLQLKGSYNLADQFNPINFQLEIPKLGLKSIEPILAGSLKNLKGILKGNLEINGSIEQPDLIGKISFDQTAFDVKALNTRIRLGTQAIVFDANAIEFKALEIFDANDNKGVISSYLLTEDYRNFYLQSELKVQDFLILNTKAGDHENYYGTLLVDANAQLKGDLFAPTIDITAKAKQGSDLNYIYTNASNQLESHQGIVEFIQIEQEAQDVAEQQRIIEVSDQLNLKVIVKLSIDDNLNFKAITNPITNDYFEGKLKGDLVYVQNPNGEMELSGALEVIKGKYLFSYQNLIRRPFQVKPGGTISWTGDPFNPKLNIDVGYKLRTSVYPLIANTDNANKETVSNKKQNFLVNLNIGGTPSQTDINASIEYPKTDGNSNDAAVQEAIDRINQNQNSKNTQAFALILFNGFLSQSFENSDFKVLDITGNINNMITQQLNGLANRYIKFVDLDFGLESYQNDDNNPTTDFRVSIRKRFLNDRLAISIDGKTSTRNNPNDNSSTYLDNITIEYALTPDGRIKVKVYNQRDYDDFIGGSGIKFGGAFVFSKEFNGIKLFKKNK